MFSNCDTNLIIQSVSQRKEEEQDQITKIRKQLREKLLTEKLLGENEDLEFTGTFDGSGDSGQYNNDAGNQEVDKLFSLAIDAFVTFDWYNNDGGGGDITWDVVADKIIINGYYNEIIQTSAMEEAEF